MEFTKQRGTVDLIDDDARYFTKVEHILGYIAHLYNFDEIRTPIFEATNLFTKAIGETTDVVKKEFYNFKDKGDRDIALRPEGTAGTIRAIIEEKMVLKQPYPVKVFYLGPMFRYERPQSGRQRQFHQFGVEVVGNINVNDEIECICLAISILNVFNIKNFELEINNIGSAASRKKWINELQKYFEQFKEQLSEDSLNRLPTNPLRILDDKVDGKKDFVKNAPKLDKFLSNDEKQYFEKIKTALNLMGIKYKINPNLVRGLDYYTGLVFEFISKSDNLKGQSTLIGGGKYDGLVKLTGGPDVPGVGFGLGIERIIIAIKDENNDFLEPKKIQFVTAPLSENASNIANIINLIFRTKCKSLSMLSNTYKLDKHFKYAEKLNADYVLILGDKELEKNEVIIKNQKDKSEKTIKLNKLEEWIDNLGE